MNSNTVSCPPTLNTDLVGFGVRLSFYLQTLFTALHCIRSEFPGEHFGCFALLAITNISLIMAAFMTVASSETPQISLPDVLVVLYLLGLSRVVRSFSFPPLDRMRRLRGQKTIMALSFFESLLIFAFPFAALSKWTAFGSSPSCISEVIVVIGTWKSHSARLVGWVLAAYALGFNVMWITTYYRDALKTICSYIMRNSNSHASNDSKGQHAEQDEIYYRLPTSKHALDSFDGEIFLRIFGTLILWSIAVASTETFIKNNFEFNEESQRWSFGGQEVLPMLVVVIPLQPVVQSFYKYGIGFFVKNKWER